MVSSEACSRGSENECEAPRNSFDIKEKCIVVMMVTGTMFEMGEVSYTYYHDRMKCQKYRLKTGSSTVGITISALNSCSLFGHFILSR